MNRQERLLMRSRISAIISVILGMSGLCLFLYPTAADWQSQILHAQELESEQHQSEGSKAYNEAMLNEARAYNEALNTNGGIISAGERLPQSETEKNQITAYEKLFNESNNSFARIKIPSIDVDLPVYKGVSEKVLERGVGHLPGTSLPVGGAGTHSVLSAHRGLASSTLFTNLDKVKLNERFTVETAGEVLSYRVVEIKVVKPEETEFIRPQEGRDLLTLVTCTPLGINSDRILVISERVYPTPTEDIESALQEPEIDFPWWMFILGAGIVASVYIIWTSGPKKKKDDPENAGTIAEETPVNDETTSVFIDQNNKIDKSSTDGG